MDFGVEYGPSYTTHVENCRRPRVEIKENPAQALEVLAGCRCTGRRILHTLAQNEALLGLLAFISKSILRLDEFVL